MLSPGFGLLLLTVLEMPMSAPELPLPLPGLFTVKLTVEELFPLLESVLVDVTVARLTMDCPAVPLFMVALMVVVAEDPFSNVPMVHKLVVAL